MTEIHPANGSEDEARGRILALLDQHSKAAGKSFKSEMVLFEAHEDGRYLGVLISTEN